MTLLLRGLVGGHVGEACVRDSAEAARVGAEWHCIGLVLVKD